MKKFLSLVLALVMTMSLVTVSAGAKDFTDSSSITYKEAVDVMSAVGVIDGYADGDFRPTATLTRGAAAKIICNLILGPTTAAALSADAAPYSDVPADSTFAGYIAYCQKEGIISGYADGTFRPGNTLTGYAFMKMLLGALGYDVAKEGYTGSNWSIAVAKRALNIGLDDGLVDSFNGVKTVTREEACLYALNMMKATMVEYENDTTITAGNVTVSTSSKAQEVTTASDKATIKAGGTVQFAEKYFTKLVLTDDSKDAFGRPANKWTYKSVSVGTYNQTPDLTYTTEVKGETIWADLGEPDDVVLQGAKGVKGNYMVDGLGTSVPGTFAVAEDNDDTKIGGNGVLTEVYFDDETHVARIVLINTYLAQATADYDEDDEELSITVFNSNVDEDTLDADDFDIADYKEDDYLLITAATDKSGNWTVKSVAPATVVENVKVSAYKSTKYVTAGGTKYEYNATMSDSAAQGYSLYNGKYTLADKAYNLIVDANGYVVGVEGYTATTDLTDYLFVKEVAPSGFEYRAKVVFADGTSKTVTVSQVASASGELKDVYKYDNSNTDGAASAADGVLTTKIFYTFNVDKDGNYELTAVNKAKRSYVTGKIVNGSAKPVEGLSIKATTDTVFTAKKTSYTGVKNAPDVKSSTVYYVLDDEGYLLWVYTAEAGTSVNDADEYVFLFATNGVGEDDDENTYYIWDAVVKGQKDTFYTSDVAAAAPGLFKVEQYTDGYANVKGQKITATVAGEVTYEAGLSVVKGTSSDISYKSGIVSTTVNAFVLDDDVVIYNIDTGDKTVKSITASKLNTLASDTYTLYAIHASTTDETVVALYVVHA